VHKSGGIGFVEMDASSEPEFARNISRQPIVSQSSVSQPVAGQLSAGRQSVNKSPAIVSQSVGITSPRRTWLG
jgi:hypothetical protein